MAPVCARGQQGTPQLGEGKEGQGEVMGRGLSELHHGTRWTPEQLALLGTLPDAEVARRTGRTPNAVRIKRERVDGEECDRQAT